GFDDPNPAHRSNYIPVKFTPGRTHFTARSLTTTRHALVIGPKRHGLCRGLTKPTRAQRPLPAKTGGSRSAKAIEPHTRNGKTQDRSERTIGNTCLAMSVQSPT